MADELSEQEIFDSATEPKGEVQPETEQPTDGQPPRDEQGRFAPKAETQPEPEAPQPQSTQPAATEEPSPETNKPPAWVLEERRVRQEKEQALEQRLAAAEAQSRAFQALLMGQQRPQQQPPQPPDFFENPHGFVQHQVQPLQQHVQQALQFQQENFSRLMAVEKFGEEAVNAAYSELENRVKTNPGMAHADMIRVMNSPHPYGELVKWHRTQQTVRQVGDDPNAWFEKTLEQKLADPAFQQKLAGKLGPAQQGSPNNNRSAPIVRLPSINRASGSAAGVNDSVPQSEEDIYNAAPAKMGRRG